MPFEFRADLHCHSCFSDGTDTPEQLIRLAVDRGLSGLAIADHDTIAAYLHHKPDERGTQQTHANIFEIAKQQNIFLLSGIEFSAAYGEEPVHILGYGFDLKSEAILALCNVHKKRRENRNLHILEKLRNLGISIHIDELNHGNLKGSIGRPHIAHVLQERGIVRTMQEAFELYLAEGKSAYDPGEPLSVEETIATIHQGQGKAVLAHPHLLRRSTTVRALLKMPFDGLECYYARFSSGQQKKWLDLAHQRKWLITGGSDYHGLTKPFNILGSAWVGKENFDMLYNHFLSVNDTNTED